MEIREYEDFIRTQITNVIENIVEKNKTLNISAKSRAGAEVSLWLENAFVNAVQDNEHIVDAESSPEGKTKHPWDARCFFQFKNHKEEIWIDFKAFKISGVDSNPDIGSPDKVIKFIKQGGFYLLYIHVYYEEFGKGLKFTSFGNKKVKSYFLKDISETFRRTPTNQLQVNISAQPSYRTREEFVILLMKKKKEGLIRQLQKTQQKLDEIDRQTEDLKTSNAESEKVIEEKIR